MKHSCYFCNDNIKKDHNYMGKFKLSSGKKIDICDSCYMEKTAECQLCYSIVLVEEINKDLLCTKCQEKINELLSKSEITETEMGKYLLGLGYDVWDNINDINGRVIDSTKVIEFAIDYGYKIKDEDTQDEFIFIKE